MRKNLSKVQRIALTGVLCILAAGIIIWQVLEYSRKDFHKDGAAVVLADTNDWELELEENNKGGAKEGIFIPGYGDVTMQQGAGELPISLGNPKENDCYFQVTAALLDGTVLYESDYIKPGQGMSGIPLKKAIEPGTYEVQLTYRCYAMDEKMAELNGAESGFQLTVI